MASTFTAVWIEKTRTLLTLTVVSLILGLTAGCSSKKEEPSSPPSRTESKTEEPLTTAPSDATTSGTPGSVTPVGEEIPDDAPQAPNPATTVSPARPLVTTRPPTRIRINQQPRNSTPRPTTTLRPATPSPVTPAATLATTTPTPTAAVARPQAGQTPTSPDRTAYERFIALETDPTINDPQSHPDYTRLRRQAAQYERALVLTDRFDATTNIRNHFVSGRGCIQNPETRSNPDVRNPLISRFDNLLPCAHLNNEEVSNLSERVAQHRGSLTGLVYTSNLNIDMQRYGTLPYIRAVAQQLFRNRDLRWANLRSLRGVQINFQSADLSNATLPVVCRACNFSDAKLRAARPRGARISDLTLENFDSTLANSNFSSADLRGLVFFDRTNLENARFRCARFDLNTFPRSGSQLRGATFSDSSLRQAAAAEVNPDDAYRELRSRLETAGATIEPTNATRSCR